MRQSSKIKSIEAAMKLPNILTRRMASLAIFAALAVPLYAVDGVVLINQSAALAGNVTPGDAPGFPVTISVSGSYRLSGNLTVPDANTTAIRIAADDVTVDLNGFSIIGPIVCSGGPPVTSCSPGTGAGIFSDKANTTVLNGTIRGMADGIDLFGEHSRAERIHAIGNGGNGIAVESSANSSSVVACAAGNNLRDGIFVNGLAIGNTANGNGGRGIFINPGGAAINNIANFNKQDGIVGNLATISGNAAFENRGTGITGGCPSALVSNTAFGNSGGDIFTSGSGCTRANNAPQP
jgi:hypothetical protein